MTHQDYLEQAAATLREAMATPPATTPECWTAINHVRETLYPLLRRIQDMIVARGMHLARHPNREETPE